MALIERDEALRILTPYLQVAVPAFQSAYSRARAAPDPVDLLDQTTTCRAILVRDYAVGELSRRWAGNPGVRQDHHAGQHLFIVDNTFAVRVKKLDESSRSHNYRTPHDEEYRNQQTFEEIGQQYNLELGYVEQPLATGIRDVRLTCLNGPGVPYWWHSLMDPAEQMYDLFQNRRLDPTGPTLVRPNIAVTVKPKKA